MFDALRKGTIAAAWTGTADAGVPSDVAVLADRKPVLIQAENVVPLYRRNELDQQQLRAINELAGVLDTGSLVDMRRQVAEGADPRTVAESWLSAHPLGR
nr:glycine betaine ABC transporter substrate-binding protein [Mycobacterium sp. M26]